MNKPKPTRTGLYLAYLNADLVIIAYQSIRLPTGVWPIRSVLSFRQAERLRELAAEHNLAPGEYLELSDADLDASGHGDGQ